MYQPIFLTILRLALLALTGFVLFKPEKIRRYLLKPAMCIIMNVLFPLHFVWSLPLGWDRAVEAGLYWMPIFFFASLFMIGFQTLLSRLFVRPKGLLDTEQPRSMTALFAIHNAGYIPLPIMVALAPQEVNIYLFMYFLGFNIIFWSAAIHLVKAESKGFTFKLNPPLVGIIVGMLIAIFDLFQYIPDTLLPLLEFSGTYALDLMMVLLGAVLATIPRSDFSYRPEFGRLIAIRLLLYPLAMLGVAALLPLGGLSQELQWGLRLALVVQAAVPPATNLMLAAKLFGNTSQVHYIGSGIMFTYLSVIITLPIFLMAATCLFR
ncbi:MAG: AEC family transporter [Spirochaetaceae bacterium]